jgi:hypothetical protein
MEEACNAVTADIKKIEEDSEKIDCYSIPDLIKHSLKSLIDSINRRIR